MVNIKVLYLGYVLNEFNHKENKAVSVANNNMELGLLNGLHDSYQYQLDVWSIKPLASFPKDKKIIVKNSEFKINENQNVKSIGYINIPILKQMSIIINLMLKLIVYFTTSRKEDKIIVLTNNSNSILSMPLFIVKSLYKNVKTVCLVVDYPKTFQSMSNFMLEFLKFIENYYRLLFFKKYDGMITLVEQTVKDFAPNIPYIVIDYSVYFDTKHLEIKNINAKNSRSIDENERIDLVFTGALETYYGIEVMLEAMKYLPKNYFLNLYGQGSLNYLINEYSSHNENIEFHGLVSNFESKKAQKEADFLLLIRTDQELNKYGLPSKIIEYLDSGNPVISSLIPAVPDKFRKYTVQMKDNSVSELVETILTAKVNYKSLKINAEKASNFIKTECIWYNQSQKIVKFLDGSM